MNALESPLEALALNHLTHGVLTAANNVLALIAFITAAVSFWKIRASVSPPKSDHPFPPQTFLPPVKVEFPPPSRSPAAAPEKVPSCTVEGTRGEKFTAYYRDDGVWEEEEERDEDYDVGGDGRREAGPGEGWDGALTLRMGEMGWYRYQDLTALNGSVVRLWDGGVMWRDGVETSVAVTWQL